jgi:hypothetical protein
MDPFRIGLALVVVAAAVWLLAVAIPLLVQALFDVIPGVLILATIFWAIRRIIGGLLS